ncbi:PREDICTED: sphingomyelin phosphodiesterase 3-like [Gekko japonicus]|uniref:sphingomyelin phosphodiesterase n=1 Tax=Gekko japonicus TaxID=146911 RepID=A0ABM1KED2_GEKJA|nr:PREDICTED: sphingomyelin phosphodiesterase 3-like [Gekko japonicus]
MCLVFLRRPGVPDKEAWHLVVGPEVCRPSTCAQRDGDPGTSLLQPVHTQNSSSGQSKDSMGLRESPFSSCFLRNVDAMVRRVMKLTFWSLNNLLALKQTTAEKREYQSRRCLPYALWAILKGLILLLLLLASLPSTVLCLPVWLLLQVARRPFAYQHVPRQTPPEEWILPGKAKAFRFVSSNVCLLPDGLAKYSNLGQTQERAKQIAQGLVQAASHIVLPQEASSRGNFWNGFDVSNGKKYGANESSSYRIDIDMAIKMPLDEEKATSPREIMACFPPNVDFLCLQEVFDPDAAACLLQSLGPYYEHILYDVGFYGFICCSALKWLSCLKLCSYWKRLNCLKSLMGSGWRFTCAQRDGDPGTSLLQPVHTQNSSSGQSKDSMGLRESPFSSCFLRNVDAMVRRVMKLTFWSLNNLLALKQTTAEKREYQSRRCLPYALWAILKGLILLLLLLASLPSTVLCLPVWLLLQVARRPFAYQHVPRQTPPEEWILPGKAKAFRFVSSNVCLLPDGLAKYSNLGQTQERAKQIAQGLVQAASHIVLPQEASSRGNFWNGFDVSNGKKYGANESSSYRIDIDMAIKMPLDEEKATSPREIMACFPPNVDFLCLQEVFDPDAAACLLQSLGPYYEHILYDVGFYGFICCSALKWLSCLKLCSYWKRLNCLKLLNSGLFLASRYPMLAVQYHCYPNGREVDILAAKGLLCVQVQLGVSQGQRIVGYMYCTHLDANTDSEQIRYDQLNQCLHWTEQFQETNARHGDIVAFDVFCGDLNFDNCSSGNEMEQVHEIFSVYTDPCRIGPQRDQPWALGTLINSLKIYDEAVATPENMKRTLEDEKERQKYLEGPILADGQPDLSAIWSEGRRLDYILYREHLGPVELKVAVEKFSFITKLSRCSDHLPVGLQLSVTPVVPPRVRPLSAAV